MAILIAYASKYGSTQGIADRIGERLRQAGLDVEVRRADDTHVDVADYDAFVIGSGVYSGSWLPDATNFVQLHSATLSVHPVWLFSSGPLGPQAAAAQSERNDPDEVLGQIKIFSSMRTIHWPLPKEIVEFRGLIRPRDHEMFFGALDHKNLPFAERMAIKAVGGMEGDFRDWPAIDAWAESVAYALTPARVTSLSR